MDFDETKKQFSHPHVDYLEHEILPHLDDSVKAVD